MEIEALAGAEDCLPGEQMEALLKTVASWKNTTTVIIHGGCVFEFKGRFPEGQVGHGYYNLHSAGGGFEGHLSLSAVASIGFQDKPHRGQESYAFVFNDAQGDAIFKLFLGRDAQGQLWPEQVAEFNRIRSQLTV